MSQEPKQNPYVQKLETLAKQFEDLKTSFNSKIAEIEKQHEPSQPIPRVDTAESVHVHAEPSAPVEAGEPTVDVISRHLKECPNCFRDVAQRVYGLKPEGVCVDCGEEIIGNPENCPNCHGTKARRK